MKNLKRRVGGGTERGNEDVSQGELACSTGVYRAHRSSLQDKKKAAVPSGLECPACLPALLPPYIPQRRLRESEKKKKKKKKML